MAKAVPNDPGSGPAGDDEGALRPDDAAESTADSGSEPTGSTRSDDADGQPARPEVPRPVRGAALVTLVEAVALGGGGIYWLIRTLLDKPENFSASLAGAVFALLAALLLVRLAVGISRLEGWSRSPLVVLQILFLPVAYTLAFPAKLPLVGLPVLALCATVLYLIFTPEGRLAFMHR